MQGGTWEITSRGAQSKELRWESAGWLGSLVPDASPSLLSVHRCQLPAIQDRYSDCHSLPNFCPAGFLGGKAIGEGAPLVWMVSLPMPVSGQEKDSSCVCVCVCVHMHTLHTVSYSVDRVSIHSRFTGTASISHIWPPQTVEIS